MAKRKIKFDKLQDIKCQCGCVIFWEFYQDYFWDLSGEDRVKVLANMGIIPAAKTTHLPQNVEAQFIREIAKEGRLNELIGEI